MTTADQAEEEDEEEMAGPSLALFMPSVPEPKKERTQV